MSNYILHNIGFAVTYVCDFDQLQESDKPVNKYPNYYLGKLFGKKGNELELFRTRQRGKNEHIPNCVLSNHDGIALIRVHNRENLTFYELPENKENDVADCKGESKWSYPYGYVVVDYRDNKCQVAIEKASAWDSKTTTIRKSLEEYFNLKLETSLGITTTIKEKTIKIKFEEFIDKRTIDFGDVIESVTFDCVNTRRNPTARIPQSLTEPIDGMSKMMEFTGALKCAMTMFMGENVDNEKLKLLSTVVTMCVDNAFDLSLKFRDYGEYKCNKDILAQYPMNDIVISNFKDNITPDRITSDFDLTTWLNEKFEQVKEGKYDKQVPTKPMH
jgi:hypothetical protein